MLRVAVVGDSAMWGQGLRQDEKYAFQYVDWLRHQGIEVNLSPTDFLAHSGAIIGNESDLRHSEYLTENDADDATHFRSFYPEVPTSHPTILKQLAEINKPETVDVLIMNGGINDVGIMNIATIVDENFPKVLGSIKQLVKKRVPELLKTAHNSFVNAKIIYVGYYPALSHNSNLPTELLHLIPGLGTLFFLFFAAPQEKDIKDQSIQFHKVFLLEANRQISKFNSKNGSSIIFCPSGFGVENAVLTDKSFVFGPSEDRDNGVEVGRQHYCQLVSDGFDDDSITSKEEFDQNQCDIAYIFHPNQAGADKYTDQLKKFGKNTFCFELRETLSSLHTKSKSYRQVLKKFALPKSNSLRQLSNMKCINVILVSVKFNSIAVSTSTVFPNKVEVDLGWGRTTVFLEFRASNGAREGVLDLKGDIRMNALNKIELIIPKFNDSLKFEIDLKIAVNGNGLAGVRKIRERDFDPKGLKMSWQQQLI